MLNSSSVDRAFHALAEPTRRAIVEKLSAGPSSVSALAEPFSTTLAAIVQHLRVLEDSGIIRTEKVGRVRTCHIEPAGLNVAAQWIGERRALWERRLDRLGRFWGRRWRRRGPTRAFSETTQDHEQENEPEQEEEKLMSKPEVIHSSFVIERTYPAPPARVFAAFADTSIKKRWFLEGGLGSSVESYAADFRVGGTEASRFRFAGNVPGAPPAGTVMGNETVYLDIVENERVVFAYAMLVGERRMSASLATVVLSPAGKGTRLTFTEQAAFFDASDGPELRKNGWTELLAKIDRAIEA